MDRQPSLALQPVLRSGVSVYSWGRGDLGQLGMLLTPDASPDSGQAMEVDGDGAAANDASGDCALLPVHVDQMHGKDVVHVAAGPFNTAFITADGELYTCGASNCGQLGVRSHHGNSQAHPVTRVDGLDVHKVTHVAYGQDHALAVTDKGVALSWGAGEWGQLGMGQEVQELSYPRLIKAFKKMRLCRVAAGANHSLCLASNGQVYSFGQGSSGALGHGNVDSCDVPQLVKRLWHMGIVQVSCGESHSAALTADGRVLTWGKGKYGALGTGDFISTCVPVLVKSLLGIPLIQVACGGDHTLALTASGAVYSWGHNSRGQLGLGSTDNTCRPNRVLGALEGQRVVQVAAGYRHSAVLTSTNEVLVWGAGEQGQLGCSRTILAQMSPLALPPLALPQMPVLFLAAGGDHMLAVVKDVAPGEKVAVGPAYGSPSPLQHTTSTGHGAGMLPTPLPVLLDLIQAAATEAPPGKPLIDINPRTSPRDGTAGSSGGAVGPALTQLLMAVEDVFSSPGFLAAGFTKPTPPPELPGAAPALLPPPSASAAVIAPDAAQADARVRHQEGMMAILDRCGVKSHAMDVEAISTVYQALLRLYSPEVVACLGQVCMSLLTTLDELLADRPPGAVAQEASPHHQHELVTPEQQNWLPSASVLPALFVLVQNPLNSQPAVITSAGSAALAGSLWSKLVSVWLQLHPLPQQILAHWVAALPPEIFGGRVLRPLQAHITRCCERGYPHGRSELLAAAKVLNLLFQAHSNLVDASCSWGCTALLSDVVPGSFVGVTPLPLAEWSNKTLSESINLRDEYVLFLQAKDRGRQDRVDAALVSLCQVPILLTAEAKSRIMQGEASVQKQHIIQSSAVNALLQGINPHAVLYLDVHVRRDNVLQDALHQIIARREDLKKPLRVVFIGPGGVPEEGLDEGGVSREFFQLVVAEIFREEYGMFVWNEETRTFWFNPCSFEAELEFQLVGAILGLAIYNNIILDVHLPSVTYKKLLGQTPGWRDLCETQPSLARGLAGLLSFEGDVENTFCRTFEVEYDFFGETRKKELMPGGAAVAVTADNRQQYVQLYTKWVLEDSVNAQFEAFKSGFVQVCGGPALSLLSPAELELLVAGLPHLDFTALEAGARYEGGFSAGTAVVRWFWSELQSMNTEQKKRFLRFTTGCDRAPVGGLGKLTLTLQKSGPDSDRLPTAHTCFNVLLLPEYQTQAKLRDRLLTAMDNAQGFGLQ